MHKNYVDWQLLPTDKMGKETTIKSYKFL